MEVVWLNAGLLISIQPLPSLSNPNPNPIYSKKTEDKVTLWGRVQQEQGWTNSQHPLATPMFIIMNTTARTILEVRGVCKNTARASRL